MPKILYLIFITIVALGSCRKKLCSQEALQVMPSGFDTTELAEIIVRKYPKYNAFHSPLETRKISATNYMQLFGHIDLRIMPENDWIIEFPLAGRTFHIANLARYNEKNKTTGTAGIADRCVDGFSCTVNDNPVQLPTKWGQNEKQILTLGK